MNRIHFPPSCRLSSSPGILPSNTMLRRQEGIKQAMEAVMVMNEKLVLSNEVTREGFPEEKANREVSAATYSVS